MGNTTAASAKGISRTQNDRITDLLCKCHAVRYVFHDKGCRHRLSDLFHCGLEFQTVLRLFDCFGCRSDQTHIVFF